MHGSIGNRLDLCDVRVRVDYVGGVHALCMVGENACKGSHILQLSDECGDNEGGYITCARCMDENRQIANRCMPLPQTGQDGLNRR